MQRVKWLSITEARFRLIWAPQLIRSYNTALFFRVFKEASRARFLPPNTDAHEGCSRFSKNSTHNI